MGGGGGDGGAAEARADEQARQARIRQGTAEIDKIFNGYDETKGVGAVDRNALADGQTYYTADGNTYTYHTPVKTPANSNSSVGDQTNWSMMSNQRSSAIPMAPTTAMSMAASRPALVSDPTPAELFAGVSTTHHGGFDDSFFKTRQDDYLAYATPQLEDQYTHAKKDLVFALDRSGTLNSSARAEKEAELQKLYDTNRRAVADQGLSYSNQSRNNIEDARGNLITTLNATGDAEGAAKSAIARANALSQPDTYSPLGQLFATFTNGLSQQRQYELANQYAGTGVGNPQIGRYNTGLFGTKGAVQTTS